METSHFSRLVQQAEKNFPHSIDPGLLAICPTFDLIAIVTPDQNVDAYRLSGQRAFGVKRKNANVSVDCVCWKFNGTSLAVAWTDGLVDIVNTDSGKLAARETQSRGVSAPNPTPRISCLGWDLNFIDTKAVKQRTAAAEEERGEPLITDDWDKKTEEISLDDFLDPQPTSSNLKVSNDLPEQLASLDVGSLLPKLSPMPMRPSVGILPGDADAAEAFTSQSSLDAIFHQAHLKDSNSVDVRLVCRTSGKVTPIIYEAISIGDLGPPATWGLSTTTILKHSSHPFSCTHGLLAHIADTGTQGGADAQGELSSGRQEMIKGRVACIPLTLNFLHSSGGYLQLIASKATQLLKLTRYINHAIDVIDRCWMVSQDLPSRFIGSIEETLSEAGQSGLIQNLYHLAVTGHCPPTIKEWLVNELAERGQKRWDAAVSHEYAKIIQYTHENLLPALERCTVIASTLRGLAIYHDSSTVFNLPPQDFTNIIHHVSCLRFVAHQILIYAGDESRQFRVFSKWLRQQIDVQASSNAGDDRDPSQEPMTDYPQLLAYIQGAMTNSKLRPFLQSIGSVEAQSVAPDAQFGMEHFEQLINASRLHREGLPVDPYSLWISRFNRSLITSCHEVFRKIASQLVRNTSLKSGIVLEHDATSVDGDVRMVYEKTGKSEDMATYIAFLSNKEKHQIRLHRIRHSPIVTELATSVGVYETLNLTLPSSGEIKDVKFLNDTHMLIIYRMKDSSMILALPYSSKTEAATHYQQARSTTGEPLTDLNAVSLPNGRAPGSRPVWAFEKEDDLKPYITSVFKHKDRFVPAHLQAKSRKGRGMICVLNEDAKWYKVFEVDETGPSEGDAMSLTEG